MYPSIYSIWWALQFAENEGYLYFDFMDAGRIHEKRKPLSSFNSEVNRERQDDGIVLPFP